MILRWVITITYLVVLALAILVQLKDPAIASYLFYGVLAWFVLSIFIYRLPAMNRPIGWSKKSSTPSSNGTAPLPSSSPSVSLDFCTNCGTHVPPGTSVCPSCGRTILPV